MASHPSHAAHSSHAEGFIPPHGGYENLLSCQKPRIIYDATVKFCDRFIDKRSRTHDQMVQAARNGNKNISEGSQVSGTSKESELKLVNVARGSLEELLKTHFRPDAIRRLRPIRPRQCGVSARVSPKSLLLAAAAAWPPAPAAKGGAA